MVITLTQGGILSGMGSYGLVTLEFLALILTVGFIPVLVNKTTEIHFDWIKPYLRECWTIVFVVLSAVYLLTSPHVKEAFMKLHHSVPGWLGYTLCIVLGSSLFSGFWWFTGKALTPPKTVTDSRPLQTNESGKQAELTDAQRNEILSKIVARYKKKHKSLPSVDWVNQRLAEQNQPFRVTWFKEAQSPKGTLKVVNPQFHLTGEGSKGIINHDGYQFNIEGGSINAGETAIENTNPNSRFNIKGTNLTAGKTGIRNTDASGSKDSNLQSSSGNNQTGITLDQSPDGVISNLGVTGMKTGIVVKQPTEQQKKKKK